MGASPCEIVLVGGAHLLLHGLRESMCDVDTVTPISSQLAGASARMSFKDTSRQGLGRKRMSSVCTHDEGPLASGEKR